MSKQFYRGSLNPIGRAPANQQVPLFTIPLHPDTGLQGRGFGLGTCGRTSTGWYFDPSTELWVEAASGVERIEGRGLLVEPESTNLCLQNRTLTTSPWSYSATMTQDETGIDGSATTAWTASDDDTGVRESFSQAITVADDSNSYCLSLFIKKTKGVLTFPGIQIYMSGGTTVSGCLTLNTNTGGFSPRTYFPPDLYGCDSYGDWWRVWLVSANNSTGNTTLTIYIHPAVNTDAGGTWLSTTTGSIIVDMIQVEQSIVPTSPIVTAGTSVTRTTDAGLYTWPIPSAVSTMLADEGTIITLLTTGFDRDLLSINDQGILSSWNGSASLMAFATASNGTLYSWDGATNCFSGDNDWYRGRAYPVALRWGYVDGGTKYQLGWKDVTEDWVWGTDSVFDGAFADGGIIYLGVNNTTAPFHIKNIHFYSLLTQAQIEAMIP